MVECKDCVHNKVCAEVNSLKCRKDFIWYDAKYGCPYYSADFVPKSEVERLEHILDCYALQYGTVTEQREVIDKAKAEVAREIFEEIEKIDEDIASFQEFYSRIMRLKKKYTEIEG